jgi:hypothetical protein
MSTAPTQEVQFTANLQPAPACYPPDINGLLQLIAGGGLSGTIAQNAGGGIYVGSIPPSSSLTNKVWFKIDAAGRPIGTYMFYNGNWRKVYTGIGVGEVRSFAGPVSLFDATGRAIIGGDGINDLDGWAICNGNNGTPNMEAFTLVGGIWATATDGTGYTGWVTDADGLYWRSAGGSKRNTITAEYLPALHTPIYGVPLNATLTPGTDFFSPTCSTTAGADLICDQALLETPAPHAQVDMPKPLFVAVAFIMFIGYA